MDFFKKIKRTVKHGIEDVFEMALGIYGSFSKSAKTAKELKVSVKISNTVDTQDARRKLSLLAQKTWYDLFTERERCELKGPVNVEDILFVICIKEGKLTVEVQSEYLKKEEPESEIAKSFKQFIDEANEIFDEVFDRDRSLNLPQELVGSTSTKQVNLLTGFFEEKLRKIFFAVLIRKFVAEISK